jgi:hypothetical protein
MTQKNQRSRKNLKSQKNLKSLMIPMFLKYR